jgi:hypothetical protein
VKQDFFLYPWLANDFIVEINIVKEVLKLLDIDVMYSRVRTK